MYENRDITRKRVGGTEVVCNHCKQNKEMERKKEKYEGQNDTQTPFNKNDQFVFYDFAVVSETA